VDMGEASSSNPSQPWAWLVAPDGQTVPLAGDQLTCGRSRENYLVLGDPSVSRRHARFERRPDGVVLGDLGSSNGTYVNDESVPPESPRPLHDGDRLTIGAYTFTLRLVSRPARAAPVAPQPEPEPQPVPQPQPKPARERHTAQLFVILPEIVTVGKLVYSRIRAQGVLNGETIQPLLEACQRAVEQQVTQIMIDASGVDYIDSTGIGGLVRLQRHLGELSGGVAIVAPPPSVRQILELMNLSSFLPMYPDESQAVAAANSASS
jgi:anti-anti-sigma factor